MLTNITVFAFFSPSIIMNSRESVKSLLRSSIETSALVGGYQDYRRDFEDTPMLNSAFTYSSGAFQGNNLGIWRQDEITEEGVRVTINPFQFDENSSGGMLDHVKFLKLSPSVPLKVSDVVSFKCLVGAQIIQPAIIPDFVVSPTDPRVGCVALRVITDDFVVFDILFTNDAVYASYARLPFGWVGSITYSAFTSFCKLKSRNVGEIHCAEIVVNKFTGIATWVCDDVFVQLDHIGYQPGKTYVNEDPNDSAFTTVIELTPPSATSQATDSPSLLNVQVGFGALTFMDATIFNKANAEQKAYIQLAGVTYTKPVGFLYNQTLPTAMPPPFSNSATITTCYGAGAILDLYSLAYKTQNGDNTLLKYIVVVATILLIVMAVWVTIKLTAPAAEKRHHHPNRDRTPK